MSESADTTSTPESDSKDMSETVVRPRISDATHTSVQGYLDRVNPHASVNAEAARAVCEYYSSSATTSRIADLWEKVAVIYDDGEYENDPVTGIPREFETRTADDGEEVTVWDVDEDAPAHQVIREKHTDFRARDKSQLRLRVPQWVEDALVQDSIDRFDTEQPGRMVDIILAQYVARDSYIDEIEEMIAPTARAAEQAESEWEDVDPVEPGTFNFTAINGRDARVKAFYGVLQYDSRENMKDAWSRSELYDRAYECRASDEDEAVSKQTARNYAKAAGDQLPSTDGFVDALRASDVVKGEPSDVLGWDGSYGSRWNAWIDAPTWFSSPASARSVVHEFITSGAFAIATESSQILLVDALREGLDDDILGLCVSGSDGETLADVLAEKDPRNEDDGVDYEELARELLDDLGEERAREAIDRKLTAKEGDEMDKMTFNASFKGDLDLPDDTDDRFYRLYNILKRVEKMLDGSD